MCAIVIERSDGKVGRGRCGTKGRSIRHGVMVTTVIVVDVSNAHILSCSTIYCNNSSTFFSGCLRAPT